jgi:hypothetical protein
MQKVLKWLPLTFIVILFTLGIVLANMEFVRLNQVLFFPLDNGKGFNGELRLIKRYRDREERISHTLGEILLGPSELAYEKIVPVETKIQSLMLRDNALYVDFSKHFFDEIKGFSLTPQERLNYIEKSLLFNYSFINKVVITINGQLPFSPYYRIREDINSGNS